MGGNALKNCETVRLNKVDYAELELKVLARISEAFPDLYMTSVVAYSEKEDFGDLDVLLGIPKNRMHEVDIRSMFPDTNEIVRNSNVFSFEYENFQVDLICAWPDEYLTSYVYFAYNDLGNLMGRIAHKMGFKYGNDGLSYMFRTSDSHVHAEISVSKDPQKIFEFLGYDFKIWQQGFDTLIDIFEFVTSSKYFNKDIYLLENRNCTSRVRDKRRKTYTAFLRYLEEPRELTVYPWPTLDERGARKSPEHLQRALEFFPGFQEQFSAKEQECIRYDEFKKLYNGELVSEWTGLKEQALGDFMKYMRNVGQNTLQGSLQEFILKHHLKDVKGMVLERFGIYTTLKEGITI